MTRRLRSAMRIALSAAVVLGMVASAGGAEPDTDSGLDRVINVEELSSSFGQYYGDVRLGMRAYTAARIGSENTDHSIIFSNPPVNVGSPPQPQQQFRSLTFPLSAAGHMRQNRFFLEVEWRHNLDRLLKDRLHVTDALPFTVRNVKYNLTFRGEYDGVYDYGPAEYRTAYQYYNRTLVFPFSGKFVDVLDSRQTLRNTAVFRARLFQAFIEMDAGPFWFRFGRQILAWGETDVFRLMDNINPVDNSFGGFLIPLDERRVPIDMLRASYKVPRFFDANPFHEMYLEGYAAIDNATAINPGIPNGSPWQLPNLQPSSTTLNLKRIPAANFEHTRGGVQLKFNAPMGPIGEGTFGIAHYYTYLDVPAVQTFVRCGVIGPSGNCQGGFPLSINRGPDPPYLAISLQKVPTVQITGASGTFAIPSDYVRYIGLSGEPIIRTELAYFKNEPRFTQGDLDPFIYYTTPGGCKPLKNGNGIANDICTGGARTGDSWNFVLGMDLNQFIRALNPNQSFFFTTQFFYKHLNGAAKRRPVFNSGLYKKGQPHIFDGEVLPVPGNYISPPNIPFQQASEPNFIHQPVDQFFQTLAIFTQYYSGQVLPVLGILYDWGGAVVVQPQITFSRDPFRFTMSYSYLYANELKGGSGISLLRDRDNVLFQFEYVL